MSQLSHLENGNSSSSYLTEWRMEGIKAFKGLSLLLWHTEEQLLLPPLCLVYCLPEGLSAHYPPLPSLDCVTQILYLSCHISVSTRFCTSPGRGHPASLHLSTQQVLNKCLSTELLSRELTKEIWKVERGDSFHRTVCPSTWK